MPQAWNTNPRAMSNLPFLAGILLLSGKSLDLISEVSLMAIARGE